MSLLRGIFWVALFVFFTFCFVVLFEYGTHDFTCDYGESGRAAIRRFLEDAQQAGYIDNLAEIEFVE